MTKSFFPKAEQLSWPAVRSLSDQRYPGSYSCYVPLNLPFSRDLLFMTPAFTVMTELVPTGCQDGASLRQRLLNFCFGKLPFLPDFRLTRWTRPDDAAPIYQAHFFLTDELYTLEAFVPPAPSPRQACCLLKFTVENQGAVPCEAFVRTHLANPLEHDVTPFDYYAFKMDQENAPLEDASALFDASQSQFNADGKPVLRVLDAGGFEMAFEERWEAPAGVPEELWAGENLPHIWNSHHFFRVRPELRVRKGRHFLRFTVKLAPGEKRSFVLAFAVSDNALETGKLPAYETAREACLDYWHQLLSSARNHFDFGSPDVNSLAQSLQVINLQFFRSSGMDDRYLFPCQGHSNRFNVWITEAMSFLRGMTAMGYYEPVRKVLELFLSWQDHGPKPVGDFTTTEGAIGNPGPAWCNTTGGVLSAVAEYLSRSHDQEFWNTYKEQLKRAARWILGEVRATAATPGKLWSGIMPPSWASDEDRQTIAPGITDAVLLVGLLEFLETPFLRQEPEYLEFLQRTQAYRDALRRILKTHQREDGFIPRILMHSPDSVIFPKFDRVDSIAGDLDHDLLDPSDASTRRYMEYYEQNLAEEFLISPMDSDLVYVGWLEFIVARYYWRTGQWKKAWGLIRYFCKCTLSRDLHFTCERFSRSEPAHTPFQPNASCNGRLLAFLADAQYYCYDDSLNRPVRIFFAGDSPDDLQESPVRSVQLDTNTGRLTLTRQADGTFHAGWDRPQAEFLLRFPAHFRFMTDSPLESCGENLWRIPAGATKIDGRLQLTSK